MSFTPKTIEEIAAEWPADLDHFSASGMKMAYRCPEQWRQRYVLGLIQPPEGALIWGRADHRALETNFRHKREHFEDLPVADVQQAFAEAFDEEVTEAGGPREIRWQGTPESDDRKAAGWTKDKGVQLATLYREQAAPFFQPVEIEQEFSLDLPFLPVKVEGRIDLIVTDTTAFGPTPPEETAQRRMVDRKTSGARPRQINPDWRLQASVYQLIEPLVHEWHISVKPKEGARKQAPAVVLGSEYTMHPDDAPREQTIRAVEMAVAQVGHYMSTYGPDQPWPPHGKFNPLWGGSACDYCGYRPVCFWWQT